MNEEQVLRVGFVDDRYTLLDKQGQQVHILVAGDVIEVQQGEGWCTARVESGGYKGIYYVTSDGRRARFAVCMRVRLVATLQADDVLCGCSGVDVLHPIAERSGCYVMVDGYSSWSGGVSGGAQRSWSLASSVGGVSIEESCQAVAPTTVW